MWSPPISALQSEILARGPVTAGIYGSALSDYTGGIYRNGTAPRNLTHAVSIVGWGWDDDDDDDDDCGGGVVLVVAVQVRHIF